MAAIERKTKRYPSDLTDEEWDRIAPLLPKPSRRGRKPSVAMREVLNAPRYMTRSGGGWRMLPKDFPPWQTVYWWFRRFVRLMLFQTIHDIAVMMDRERAGRQASPSAGITDSQTVKAPEARRGYDAAKKTVGRKRHIVVDTDGRLLMLKSDPGRSLRQRWRPDDPRCHPQALAVGQASVRRWRLRPDPTHGQVGCNAHFHRS